MIVVLVLIKEKKIDFKALISAPLKGRVQITFLMLLKRQEHLF